MTIFCIETSTSVCSAAICKDGEPIKQCISFKGGNHSQLLPLYIEELLQFARKENLTVNAVALSEGPGSYTGLRIGASTAKGLCYGLEIPLIAVSTLEVLKVASGVKDAFMIPMIDARRMEIYTMIDGETKAVVVENEDSLYSGEADVYYFGDGAEKCAEVFTKHNWHFVPDIVPEAQYMGMLAEKGNKKLEGKDLAYYEPFYLKEFIAAQSHVKGLV